MKLQTENQKVLRIAGTTINFNSLSFRDSNTLEELVFEDNSILTDNHTEWIKSFTGCESLRKVKLPANATSIPSGIFRNCTNLEEITWPKVPFSIERYAFENTAITKVKGVTIKSIGDKAFKSCKTLREVDIMINNTDQPDQLHKNLGYGAFSKCTALKKLVVECITPTEVEDACFWHCKNLEELRLLGEVWKLSTNLVASTLECMDEFRFKDRICSNLQVLQVPKALRAFCDKQLGALAKDIVIDSDFICLSNCLSLLETDEHACITKESKSLWESLRELYPEEFVVKEGLCFDETPEETSLF